MDSPRDFCIEVEDNDEGQQQQQTETAGGEWTFSTTTKWGPANGLWRVEEAGK